MSIHRALALGLLLASAGTASASGITLTAGPGSLVLNPNNQRYTADAYNISTVFYWTEQTSHLLANDLVVSILPPASFPADSTTHAEDNSLLIAQGALIDSYYINYDPQSGSVVSRFQFDRTILGLITNSGDSEANDHFRMSDFLIDPLVPAGNIPAAHFGARGIETAGGDFIHWLSANEFEINLDAANPGDQIRVITSAEPEPGCVVLLGIGLCGMACTRRAARRHAR